MEGPVVATLPAPAERCFTLFCDPQLLRMWVPGLRRAKVVQSRPDGLPLEVKCEFDESRTYSLLYEYDLAERRVAWTPGLGSRDAVQGSATFAEQDGQCRLTYQLTIGPARTQRERELGSPREVVAAFARFVGSMR